MSPLPPGNTDRYFLDYTTAGFQHTMEMRADGSGDPAGAEAAFDAVLSELTSQVFLVTIDSFRFQLAGNNFSTLLTWGGPATYGSGAGTPSASANYVSAIGRSTLGHRVKFTLFGMVNATLGGDYRMSPGETSVVGAVLAALVADPLYWLAIDGTVPNWHNYLNVGVNAYWRNKIR